LAPKGSVEALERPATGFVQAVCIDYTDLRAHDFNTSL
jgi:hypothetical protein